MSARRTDLVKLPELQDHFNSASNYITIAAVLIASFLIGVYFWWRGNKNTHDYQLAGRGMGSLPIALSMVTTFYSAVSLLGHPALYLGVGTQFVTHIFGIMWAMVIALVFFLPLFSRLKVTTSYQYLELRFSSKMLRAMVSMYFTLTMLIYVSVTVVVPSLALAKMAGAGMNEYVWCAVLFGVCGFYTCLGGLKAVLWTDALQFGVMLGSYLILVWVGSRTEQVAGKVFDINYQANRVQWFNFDPEPRAGYTVWSCVFGFGFMLLETFGTNQFSVQRFMACKNEKVQRRSFFWAAVGMCLFSVLVCYMAMLVFAFYKDCAPWEAGGNENIAAKMDEVVAMFALQIFDNIPTLPGFLISGFLCGTLSTVSSGLNAFSTVLLQDVVLSYGYLKQWSKEHMLILSRSLALGFCLVSYAFTFIFISTPTLAQAALSLLGLVSGPCLGVFTLGMFMPFANKYGATSGFLLGVVLQTWILFGQKWFNPGLACTPSYKGNGMGPNRDGLSVDTCPADWNVTITPRGDLSDCIGMTGYLQMYQLSWLWNPVVGWLTVVVFGIVISLLTGREKPENLKPGMLSPNIMLLFCYWPSFMRTPIEKYFARAPELADEDAQELCDIVIEVNKPDLVAEVSETCSSQPPPSDAVSDETSV